MYLNVFLIFFIDLEYIAAFFFFFTSNGIISGLWFSPTPYQKDVSREVFLFLFLFLTALM